MPTNPISSQLPIPPLASPIVNPETGNASSSFGGWVLRLYNLLGGTQGTVAPKDAAYIIQAPDPGLPNAQSLSELNSGFVKVTTTSGVLSSSNNVLIQPSDLSLTSVSPNSYSINGSTIFTVDQNGRLTSASNATITAIPSGSAAGGDLTGSYPSPSLIANGVSAGPYTINGLTFLTVDANGRVSSITSPSLSPSTIGAAASGANADITSLSGLTGAIEGATSLRDATGNLAFLFDYVPSAVNYWQVINGSTGNSIGLFALGGDTNVNMSFRTAGVGTILLESQATSSQYQMYTGTGFTHLTNLSFPSTTATQTITFPDSTGTIVLTSTSDVLSQRVSTLLGTSSTGTTTFTLGNTIPTNTAGTQFLTLAITPKSSTSKLIIDVLINISTSSTTSTGIVAALFQDSTANALSVGFAEGNFAGDTVQLKIHHEMTSGTTSSTTFKIRAGTTSASTVTLNGVGGAAEWGGVYNSSIEIKEYAS